MHPHFSLTEKLESQNLLIKRHIYELNPFQSQQPPLITWCPMCRDDICHLSSWLSWCRSGARLTLDVTMSHISIKMRRVVSCDSWPRRHVPSVHIWRGSCALSEPRHWWPEQRSRKGKRREGEKETQINCKIWPPPPRRPLATYLQLAEDWLDTIEILATCLVTCHVSVAGAKFGLNIPRPLTRQPSIPGEMPAPYEEWTIDPSSLRTNDWSVPPRLWIIFRMQGGVYSIHKCKLKLVSV